MTETPNGSETVSSPEPHLPNSSQTPPRRSRRLLWWVLILCIGVAGVWWSNRTQDTPTAAVNANRATTEPVSNTVNVSSSTTTNSAKPSIPTIAKASDVTVAVISVTEADESLTAYKLLGDGTWHKIANWKRAANENGGINLESTPTRGVWSLSRTNKGANVLVDADGQDIPSSQYPLYSAKSGYLGYFKPLGNGRYLTHGSNMDNWPIKGADNASLYIINEQGAILDTIPSTRQPASSLDSYYVQGISKDGQRAYVSVAGYEGNTNDTIWKVDLAGKTFQELKGANTISYGGITIDADIEKALAVKVTQVPCQGGCLGDSEAGVPASVVLYDLVADTSKTVHTSTQYLPQVLISATGKKAFITEIETVRDKDGGIVADVGRGIWSVDTTTGTETKIHDGLLQSVSASGRFLLIASRDDSATTQNKLPLENAIVYDTELKTDTPVSSPSPKDAQPRFSEFLSCFGGLYQSCLPD